MFEKHDRNLMSRTAIILKLKMCWCLNEGRNCAEMFQSDISLIPLMPDADKPVRDSLVLDFTT